MSDCIILAEDQECRCDECPGMAVVVTGSGALLCGACVTANQVADHYNECEYSFAMEAKAI